MDHPHQFDAVFQREIEEQDFLEAVRLSERCITASSGINPRWFEMNSARPVSGP